MGRILLLLLISTVCGVLSIDVDYYLGVLRSVDCFGQKDCSKYCDGGPFFCHKAKCYCYNGVQDKVSTDERTNLRHHVAHFCPNLDVAKACVQKCVKLGKPAFCGKDHRCYCGHKLNSHSKDNDADAKKNYANFKDLYEKYFGEQPLKYGRIVETN